MSEPGPEHTTSDDVGVPQLLLEEIGDICISDSVRWFPESYNSLTHHIIALGGEVGELMNVYKKIDRGSLPPIELHEDNPSRQMLLDELTDVLIYVANIYGLLKGNPNLCFHAKRYFNEQRFGPQQVQGVHVEVHTMDGERTNGPGWTTTEPGEHIPDDSDNGDYTG